MTPCPAFTVPASMPDFFVTPGGRCGDHARGVFVLSALERKRVRLAPMPYGAMRSLPALMPMRGL